VCLYSSGGKNGKGDKNLPWKGEFERYQHKTDKKNKGNLKKGPCLCMVWVGCHHDKRLDEGMTGQASVFELGRKEETYLERGTEKRQPRLVPCGPQTNRANKTRN